MSPDHCTKQLGQGLETPFAYCTEYCAQEELCESFMDINTDAWNQ